MVGRDPARGDVGDRLAARVETQASPPSARYMRNRLLDNSCSAQ